MAESAHRLSLENIAQAATSIDPVFLRSPQFVCEPLSMDLRCRLTLKVETMNPIRCFKGRGADFFLAQRMQHEDRRALVCASAGNFGQALAYACRRRDLTLTIFAAHSANPLKVERMRALGADVRLAGNDFDAAKSAARDFATKNAASFVEDGHDPAISEGAGSIAVELLATGMTFDAVTIPLGNGALINGMARWIKAHTPATRVIGVVSRGAPAMARSWRAGNAQATDSTDTIADGIAVRVPVQAALDDMRGLVDDVIEVDEEMLIAAMRLAHQHAGLVTEPAGVAGLAALLQQPKTFAGAEVATVLCGGNLTALQIHNLLF
jgi:threonine dehydratase